MIVQGGFRHWVLLPGTRSVYRMPFSQALVAPSTSWLGVWQTFNGRIVNNPSMETRTRLIHTYTYVYICVSYVCMYLCKRHYDDAILLVHGVIMTLVVRLVHISYVYICLENVPLMPVWRAGHSIKTFGDGDRRYVT